MAGELNFNLLDATAPAKAAASVSAGMQQGQSNDLVRAQLEHAQSQNELSKYTLGAAKRGEEQQAALNQMLSQGFNPSNPEHLNKLYSYGPAGQAMVKSIQEGTLKAAQAGEHKVKAATEMQKFLDQGKRNMAENPSDANVTAWAQDAVLKGFFTPEQAQQSIDYMLKLTPEQRVAHLAGQGASAGDISTAATAKAGQQVTMRGQDIGAATAREGQGITARGQNMTADTARAGQAIQQQNATTAADALSLRREGLVELPPKEIQKREAKYPEATAAVKESTAGNEKLISDLIALRDHPGLGGITGTVFGRTPSIAGASKEAKAKFEKIMARGGFQELAKMRAASPTGGALGNVSDTEGRYLRAAFAALDPAQDTPSFQKAIDDAVMELRGSNERIKDAYAMTYDYKAPKEVSSPTPGATSTGWGKAVAK